MTRFRPFAGINGALAIQVIVLASRTGRPLGSPWGWNVIPWFRIIARGLSREPLELPNVTFDFRALPVQDNVVPGVSWRHHGVPRAANEVSWSGLSAGEPAVVTRGAVGRYGGIAVIAVFGGWEAIAIAIGADSHFEYVQIPIIVPVPLR